MPDLSIIIPALNEEPTLPALLADLFAQRGIILEIIVVDGGSSDATRQSGAALQHPKHSFLMLQTLPGRAKQMNYGAEKASAATFLFLHADSKITNIRLLAPAYNEFDKTRKSWGNHVAGHFPMHFSHAEGTDKKNPAAYYFYENKTYMNRPECINGDQGIMISQDYFKSLGKFDTFLPYMEDARLASKIFATGRWFTLPGPIHTSARRFASEGLHERQILNALMRNFNAIGFHEFFACATQAYRNQQKTGHLQLLPFTEIIHKLTMASGARRFITLWYDTGAYVAANAWQIAFALDCRHNFANGKKHATAPTPRLLWYDRWIAPCLTSPPGNLATGIATFIWFYALKFKLGIKTKKNL